jgi:hypothetical protein
MCSSDKEKTMNRRRFTVIASVAGLVALAMINLAPAWSQANMDHSGHGGMAMSKGTAKPVVTIEKIHSAYLPAASSSVDRALTSLVAGDTKTAMLELQKIKKLLAATHTALGKHVKPKFANVKCPIMGAPINPEKVAKTLIRDYKGQKIAFCCGGCPATWDKLTDAQKEAKLAKVKPAKTAAPSSH